ncbi:MAG TPA: PEGA domain-containing protein [Rariglobus sp.]|nr:PEGA domain-containing protein [Rariglobus sp.]
MIDKGRTQAVVVRSAPEGAVGLINGIEVGKTPFKIKLPRDSAATIELRKAGFENSTIVVLPVANEYEKHFLRWGVDYDLGAMTDLTPNNINVALKPAVAADALGDPYEEMTSRIAKADEMLAAKQITPQDHKYIVDQIVKFYAR